MIEHKGTSMVCFNKSRLTNNNKRAIRNLTQGVEGISVSENEINIYVYDDTMSHNETMSKLVTILIKNNKL